MAGENENFDGNSSDPGSYAPPEDRYEDTQPQSQAPGVSAPTARNFVFIGLFAIIVLVIVYVFFGGSDDKKVVTAVDKSGPITKPLAPAPVPPPPPIPIPQLPVTPPPPTTDTTSQNSAVLFPDDNSDRFKRYQSNMLISGSGLLGSTNLSSGKNQLNENDPNIGFADSFYNQSETPYAKARKLGDTDHLITQGKIIESILETPINTDLPGMIRAVVSRDIYAESGRLILIPKGSRLVGTYNNFIIRGNKRINIIWSRVIRPDGVDIMLRSEGTDQLGRAGIPADVDNKYAEIFASAFLVSAINIAIGVGVDAIDTAKDRSTTTTNTDGSTTTNSDAKSEAALRAVDLFGNAGQNLLDGFLNMKPTATIDQGTRVNVFVNRDLIFPASISNQVKIIQ